MTSSFTDTPDGFKSGFVSFVGRPNTGKSTLTNALVGQKIAITADQPETTRHPIRGIVHRPGAQIVVVDTPGLHKPRTLLGKRLNEMVKETYTDVDVVGLCVPADEKIGPGDKWILEAITSSAPHVKLIGVVTKTDKATRDQVMVQLDALHRLIGGKEVVPVSAKRGENLDTLVDVICDHLEEGPKYYPDDHVTDDDVRTRMSEFIRQAALGGLRDELPHSIAVEIDEVINDDNRPDRATVHAIIYLEREGQKAILRGHNGQRFGRIITQARRDIGELLGKNVYLDLRLKVLKNWQSDPKALGKLGF